MGQKKCRVSLSAKEYGASTKKYSDNESVKTLDRMLLKKKHRGH